jgi:hypoxanthine phosphoribosyltransferase
MNSSTRNALAALQRTTSPDRVQGMSAPAWNRVDEPFEQLISAEEIATRTSELGKQITADYAQYTGNADVVVLGVLKGSILFMADLVKHIALPVYLDFIAISSYGDASTSSGVVQITQDLTRSVEGKHIIVVEDIVDTGHTVDYLLANLATRRPASIRLCTLLHKPERAERDVKIDYLGFTIPNKFVVGYGLDIAQQYRNLPFIGFVKNP